MTAPRSTLLLLLAAACLALAAGPVFADPVETPPSAPPAGAAAEAPEGAPPGADAEEETTDEAAPAEEIVEVMKALPGRLPSTDGPMLPSVIGQAPHETSQALSAWRVRVENVVTDRSYVGRVVDQHPDAATTLAPGEVVTVVVGIASLPSRRYTSVPQIERLTLEDAAASLRRLGFGIMLRVAESYDADKGLVLAQAPRPASVALRGERVIVVVGKGGLAAPVVPVEPLEPEAPIAPLPAPEEPPAGPPSMPEGPPPGAVPPAVVPPAEAPPAVEPPCPPVPTPPTPMPPAEAPPTEPVPPTPPSEPVPPMPPTEEPPAMPIEPPAPAVPVPPPAPKVVLRVPSLVGPATGQSFPRAFGSTFQWKAVTGAKTYEWELQVEAKDGTWSTVTTEAVEGTSFRPKRMEAGRYRWRVRALAEEVEGEWSEFYRLYMYGP